MSTAFEQLTEDQIRDAERRLATRRQELEYAKWDAELVGRYFRVIREPESRLSFLTKLIPLGQDGYVTLEESLAVGVDADRYVYADVVYLHIQQRDGSELTCSGFQVSHRNRKEPYLKIQPRFYSWDDFRNYLNQWDMGSGPAKHCEEIAREEYETALDKAIKNFAGREIRR